MRFLIVLVVCFSLTAEEKTLSEKTKKQFKRVFITPQKKINKEQKLSDILDTNLDLVKNRTSIYKTEKKLDNITSFLQEGEKLIKKGNLSHLHVSFYTEYKGYYWAILSHKDSKYIWWNLFNIAGRKGSKDIFFAPGW